MLNQRTIENLILTTFLSSLICLAMYLTTAILLWYVDGINLHTEPIGYLVIMLYFVVPFCTIQILNSSNNSNDNN